MKKSQLLRILDQIEGDGEIFINANGTVYDTLFRISFADNPGDVSTMFFSNNFNKVGANPRAQEARGLVDG